MTRGIVPVVGTKKASLMEQGVLAWRFTISDEDIDCLNQMIQRSAAMDPFLHDLSGRVQSHRRRRTKKKNKIGEDEDMGDKENDGDEGDDEDEENDRDVNTEPLSRK